MIEPALRLPIRSERFAAALPRPSLVADNIADFINLEIPTREMLLGPVLPAQGLVMLYSMRGVGKTYCALGIAYAVASGGTFLRWSAPEPRRVLYIDGEMPAKTMQDRLMQIAVGAEAEPPAADFFRLITPDRQDFGIPDLATKEGQEALEERIAEGCDLLILDNLSTLCRNGKENEAESWSEVQEWLLSLRRRKISVLLVHHAGKGGNQRGTSRREDVLDTVIALRRPEDYEASDGARFQVVYEKARTIFGEDAKGFEAKLEMIADGAKWTTRDIDDANLEIVRDLTRAKKTVREIAKETGISKSAVHRLQHRLSA